MASRCKGLDSVPEKTKAVLLRRMSAPDPVTGCIQFNGSRGPNGAGKMQVTTGRNQRVYVYAHHVSCIMHKGPIPAGSCVCQTCRDAGCINPEHLYLTDMKRITQSDYRVYKKPRGRHPSPASSSK